MRREDRRLFIRKYKRCQHLLTHALAWYLAKDRGILREFVSWALEAGSLLALDDRVR